jgi:6-phosphogluconolactonase (cycloisomerase 2 family)
VRKSFAVTFIGTSLILALSLAGCGGGSSTAGGSSSPLPTNPPIPEVLVAGGVFNVMMSFSVNTGTAAVTQISKVGGAQEPISVVVTPSSKYLYSSSGGSEIDAFSISSGSLSAASGSPLQLPVAAFGLAIDPIGKVLYAANGSDAVLAFRIDSTSGSLTSIGSFSTGQGISGAGPKEVVVHPSGKFLYVSDQEGDSVSGFAIDPSSGALGAITGSPFPVTPGGQPLALVAEPTGKFLFTALSNSNSIAAFAIDSSTGALTNVPGSPFQIEPIQFTQTYSMTVAPSGKFLYAMNSQDRTISAFAINSATGGLTAVSGSPFSPPPPPTGAGKSDPGPGGPIAVDLSGNYLYVICSNPALMVFSIDANTGVISPAVGDPSSSYGPATFEIPSAVTALTFVPSATP